MKLKHVLLSVSLGFCTSIFAVNNASKALTAETLIQQDTTFRPDKGKKRSPTTTQKKRGSNRQKMDTTATKIFNRDMRDSTKRNQYRAGKDTTRPY